MRRSIYFADYTVQAGRAYIEANGSVTEEEILKATADAVADKMSKELTSVVGVEIAPPFGGLVPFGKRSAFPHAVPSKDRLRRATRLSSASERPSAATTWSASARSALASRAIMPRSYTTPCWPRTTPPQRT